jgi:hypothetical protein
VPDHQAGVPRFTELAFSANEYNGYVLIETPVGHIGIISLHPATVIKRFLIEIRPERSKYESKSEEPIAWVGYKPSARRDRYYVLDT